MSELDSLYIERNDCADCCRCIRECPLKAISLTAEGAAIDAGLCVVCGECLQVCKQDAVRLRDDVYLARKFIKTHTIKVASVSPQWTVEFEGIDTCRFVEALKLLGFTHVSESALGAEASMRKEMEMAAERPGLSISSRCPVVVDYIRKYKPRLLEGLLPVVSPMMAHARMIRSWWGREARIIHISSCVAAKNEIAEEEGLVDIVLTFKELKRWMSDEGIDFDHISGHDSYQFEPYTARGGFMYPLSGIVTASEKMLTISASSLKGVCDTLDAVPARLEGPVMLDLMTCPGGCIGSVGATCDPNAAVGHRLALKRLSDERAKISEPYTLPYIDVTRGFGEMAPVTQFVSESETLAALDDLGLPMQLQQLDCNACGYGTCRRFAKALSRREVPREMCIHYVRSRLRVGFIGLIDRLAAGVAVVDNNMQIVAANRMLATMLGADAVSVYDANPRFRGLNVVDVFPFSSMISSVLENGDDSLVRDVQIKDRIITVSVHSLLKYRNVLVICRNMLFSQVRNEEVVARTRKVVRENLETVQKIAYLLGENASRTEAILNSILNTEKLDNGE